MPDLTESQRLDFLRHTWPGAVACETATGVPALISEAQTCLESGWGAKAADNALFGVKADPAWKEAGGAVVLQPTTEVLPNGQRIHYDPKQHPEICSFRAYATPEEAFRDHAAFLHRNPRYAPCFAHARSDIDGWAASLDICGYSTDHTDKDGDPRYSVKLLQLVASVRKRLPLIGVKL